MMIEYYWHMFHIQYNARVKRTIKLQAEYQVSIGTILCRNNDATFKKCVWKKYKSEEHTEVME